MQRNLWIWIRFTLLMFLATALPACVSVSFRESVDEFGRLTNVAIVQQSDNLVRISNEEEERIRKELAEQRVDLRLSADCAARLASPETAADPAPCALVRADQKELERPPKFENILALSDGIRSYADSLVVLAGDNKQDRTDFAGAVTGLGTSLGGLDAAIRKAKGEPESTAGPKIGAIAGLIAESGNLYFAYRRTAALKRIIIKADPLLQEATSLLGGTDSQIDLYDNARLANRLLAARKKATDLAASNAEPRTLRLAQDELFNLVAVYNAQTARQDRLRDIGAAHAKLAVAARRGASPQELKEAIEALIHLAGTIHATAKATKPNGAPPQ